VLNFLYTPVSWVLLQWHHLFNAIGLNENSGLNWALSIVFLVITARLLLFRLFIKQVKYQRHMQLMQPEIQKIRKKYKDDRAEMQRQMMALQQEQGFNPLSGCLPMFLQFPIFIALYHVLRHMSNSVNAVHVLHDQGAAALSPDQVRQLTLYGFKQSETASAAVARLFGGAPLAGRLTDSPAQLTALGGERAATVTVILILVLISSGATYMTQRLVRAGNPVPAEGTAATVQRLMMYLIPIGTLGSGLFFPLGVLLYWFTSNTWTMAQQLYVNKYHPHEGKQEVPVGEVGKTLAPKPGQRPVRPGKAGTTSLLKESADATDGASGSAAQAGSAPRPGQKPRRPPTGNRPPAKRPSQAKKRR
jgi:YidC/Oxa1 family membrane protein insertase